MPAWRAPDPPTRGGGCDLSAFSKPAGERRPGNDRPTAQSTALLWQRQPDVQLAQLLGRDLRRRAHHQILGALVHRKEHDFAQILFPAEQHDDAVDAGRNPAVRRCTKRKRAQHAAELLLQRVLAVAGDGKRLAHDVWAVITDGAGGQFDAVADDVVLDRLDAKCCLRIRLVERKKCVNGIVRHGKRIMGEIDLLLLLVPFVHREIDDPAKIEAVLCNPVQFLGHFRTRESSELIDIDWSSHYKEYSVAIDKTIGPQISILICYDQRKRSSS